MIRLSWSQPEDLLPHALSAAALDGIDVGPLRRRWTEAGGASEPPVTGASRTPASVGLRTLAVELLEAVNRLNPPDAVLVDEPDELRAIELLAPRRGHADVVEPALDRLHGAWLGRAAGCLLGKPVEKVSRAGIRAIAQSTGNWPIATYFTDAGLDPAVAEEHPWNRRSAATSLAENIDGMPEDDDLNFALLALGLVERHGERITTDRVAQAWLDEIPAGRVFTAERVTYRNLLAGWEPDAAGRIGNPFQDWIGAQIRTDVYGWVAPGDPRRAARMAWADARLSHHRSGLYGAMFVAAACSMAVVAASVDQCIDAGLSVVPPRSRYARAIARGVELGRSPLTDEQAIDAIHTEFGHLHWVHALNNSALVAFALTRGSGNFERSVTTVVSGGWDTDSNGAMVGSLCAALAGASMLPAAWVDPLRNRLSTSVTGFDGIGFDELARRTLSARLGPLDPRAPDRLTSRSTSDPMTRSTWPEPTPRRSSPPRGIPRPGRPGGPDSRRGGTTLVVASDRTARHTGGNQRGGRAPVSAWRSSGCGTSGCSTPNARCSPPTSFSMALRMTATGWAGSMRWCCGTPIP